MKIFSTYSVKIKHYNHILKETIEIYREAVDYLINVCLNEWNDIIAIKGNLNQQRYTERLCHRTSDNPDIKYGSFDKRFYKFPSYLRRGAINEAIGKVSSYKSNLSNWEKLLEKLTHILFIHRFHSSCIFPTRRSFDYQLSAYVY